MSTTSIATSGLLYEVALRFTSITDYGVSIQDLLSGTQAPPLAGAQIDFAFEGSFQGPRLNGSVVGVDYAHARADGRFDLHIHARLTVADGERIAFFADGVALPVAGNTWQLRENCSFLTSSPAYQWLNRIQAWGVGAIDLEKSEVHVKVYAA